MKRRHVSWAALVAVCVSLPAAWFGSAWLRCEVYGALVDAGSEGWSRWALAALIAEPTEASLEPLLRALSLEDEERAEEAREELRRRITASPEGALAFARLAGRSDAAALSVGALLAEQEDALDGTPLIPLVRDPDPRMRRGALLALMKTPNYGITTPDPELATLLLSTYETDPAEDVRVAAMPLLGRAFQPHASSVPILLIAPAHRQLLLRRAATTSLAALPQLYGLALTSASLEEHAAFARILEADECYLKIFFLEAQAARGEDIRAATQRLRADPALPQVYGPSPVDRLPTPENQAAAEAELAQGETGRIRALRGAEGEARALSGFDALAASDSPYAGNDLAWVLNSVFRDRAALFRALAARAGDSPLALEALVALARLGCHERSAAYELAVGHFRREVSRNILNRATRLAGSPEVIATLAQASTRHLGPEAVAVLRAYPLFDRRADAALSVLVDGPLAEEAREAQGTREELRELVRPALVGALEEPELALDGLEALGADAPPDAACRVIRDLLSRSQLAEDLIFRRRVLEAVADNGLEAALLPELEREHWAWDWRPAVWASWLRVLEGAHSDDAALAAAIPSDAPLGLILQLLARRRIAPSAVPALARHEGWRELLASEELGGWAPLVAAREGGLPVEDIPGVEVPSAAEVARGLELILFDGDGSWAARSRDELAIRGLASLAATVPEARQALVRGLEHEDLELQRKVAEALSRAVFEGLDPALLMIEDAPGLGALTWLSELGPRGRLLAPWAARALDLDALRSYAAMWALGQVDPGGAVSEPALLVVAADAERPLSRRLCAVEALSWLTALSPEARARLAGLPHPPEDLRAAIAGLEFE